MPRRFIKESIKTSRTVKSLSDGAHRTLMNLIVTVDDFGRYHGDPEVLRSACYPYNDRAKAKFEREIDELESSSLLSFYQERERLFCLLNTFVEHQGPPRAGNSKFPEPKTFIENKGDSICAQMRADVLVFRVPYSESRVPCSDLCVEDRQVWADGFEQFWQIVPKDRRVEKGEAQEEWDKHCPQQRELVDALLKQILAAAGAYYSTGEVQYTKHPKRWIKAKRWEDEGLDGKKQKSGFSAVGERTRENLKRAFGAGDSK